MIQYTGHEDFLRQLTVYPLILIIDYSVCTSDVDQRFDMQRPIQHTCVYMYESSQPTASQSPHNSTRSSARWTQYPNHRAGVRSVCHYMAIDRIDGSHRVALTSAEYSPQSTNPPPIPMPTPLSWPRPIALHLTGVVLHQRHHRHLRNHRHLRHQSRLPSTLIDSSASSFSSVATAAK